MKRLYFGTDGVRGTYGGPLINEMMAARLGAAAAAWAGGQGRVVVGRDTRASGEALLTAVARGLREGGMTVETLGVAPTPAVARAVRQSGAVLGVVITASHNPASDNGIKFFAEGGRKLTDSEEVRLEALIPSGAVLGANNGAEAGLTEVEGDYAEVAAGLMEPGALTGWRVVMDTANGATCGTSPGVLRRLGAEVIGIGDKPDGWNINAGVGSEHPEAMAARVVVERAKLGIAHDGDGDRCVLCDEKGEVLDGDEILTLLACDGLERGELAGKTLVVTVQSNLGVDAAVQRAGGQVVRTPVGDRYVTERMRAIGASLGGESSGHLVCAEVSPTGDGLVAALRVLSVMKRTGRALSELRRVLKKFPQATQNLRVAEKKPLETLAGLGAAIAAEEAKLGARGRVMVRYSGTESKLRILVEGPEAALVESVMVRLKAAASCELDVI